MDRKFGLMLLAIFACLFTTSFADNIVSVEIKWKGLIIWTPAAKTIQLWEVAAWTSVQYTFDDPFWIKDLRWRDAGHYTTIQCNGLFHTEWHGSLTWVKLQTTTWHLASGLPNQTKINSELQVEWWLDITEPKLYFYRVDGGNSWWVVNKYVDYPTVIINIPEWASTWAYKWRIVYTLYDLGFNASWY